MKKIIFLLCSVTALKCQKEVSSENGITLPTPDSSVSRLATFTYVDPLNSFTGIHADTANIPSFVPLSTQKTVFLFPLWYCSLAQAEEKIFQKGYLPVELPYLLNITVQFSDEVPIRTFCIHPSTLKIVNGTLRTPGVMFRGRALYGNEKSIRMVAVSNFTSYTFFFVLVEKQ